MPNASLTFRSIQARPVLLKLRRPVVARIGTILEWPVILIDLTTEEGIVPPALLGLLRPENPNDNSDNKKLVFVIIIMYVDSILISLTMDCA